MTNQPQQEPTKAPGHSQGKSGISVLMIIVGALLLLPGLCGAAMSFGSGTGGHLIAMGMVCLAISGVGVWLIVAGSSPRK
jgi:hypothetical protein